MIFVNDGRIDCWGGWIWPSVLILPFFFAKGSMFSDSDEACSVAVLLTVWTVFMWKRLCICSGWGMETGAGTAQLIPFLQCCIFSCQFFSTCWRFLVSCFKIAPRERENRLPTGIAGAKGQISLPWLHLFSSSLPWGWLCCSCGSPACVSLCTQSWWAALWTPWLTYCNPEWHYSSS